MLRGLIHENAMTVKFVKPPTGAPFFLAYNVGDLADLDDALANRLIEKQFAVKVSTNAEKPENAASKLATKGEKR